MIHKNKDIDQLNSFLRGELSAVETYMQCIESVSDQAVVTQLQLLRSSHRRRADILALRIRELGGTPSTTSGIWGGFAKLIEGSAGVIGEKAAIAALEEGEDHGLADYERDKEKLSPVQQRFIEVEVLPEQARSHDILSNIERSFPAE